MQANGKHLHILTNPARFTFEVLCFQIATGCLEAGTPEQADSWFPGYRWRYALCNRCGEHLGWGYSGVDHFFGFIRQRLTPCSKSD